MTQPDVSATHPTMRVLQSTRKKLRYIAAHTEESFVAILERLVAQECQRLGITPTQNKEKQT